LVGYYRAKDNTRTLGFIARHPIAGSKIGLVSSGSTNISTNAVRFSARIGRDPYYNLCHGAGIFLI